MSLELRRDAARKRFPAALENLIALMPYLTRLQIYDNSVEVAPGKPVPDPVLLGHMEAGKLVSPTEVQVLKQTPEWAKPLLEEALSI